MDAKFAAEVVAELRWTDEEIGDGIDIQSPNGSRWKDPLHIACDYLRQNSMFGGDPHVIPACVELWLTEPLPQVEDFEGLICQDEVGVWFYDGDGSVDEPAWRQQVIPWRYIKNMRVHQVS